MAFSYFADVEYPDIHHLIVPNPSPFFLYSREKAGRLCYIAGSDDLMNLFGIPKISRSSLFFFCYVPGNMCAEVSKAKKRNLNLK